jgi:hypothetical protein
VIEAHYLFGAEYDDIDVVIHPQSIIHSMIETQDSSVLAQVQLEGICLTVYSCTALIVNTCHGPACQRSCNTACGLWWQCTMLVLPVCVFIQPPPAAPPLSAHARLVLLLLAMLPFPSHLVSRTAGLAGHAPAHHVHHVLA